MLSPIIVLALILGAELWCLIMAKDFDEIGSWPGQGDWRGRAERIAEWDGATPLEKKSWRDIATEHELPPKQRPAASPLPLIPTCSILIEEQPLTCLHAVTRPSFLLQL